MPQLDIVSFSNQIFSVIIIFFILFFIVYKNIVPSVQKIINVRSFFINWLNKNSVSFSNESNKISSNILVNYSDSAVNTENQINIIKDSLNLYSNNEFKKFGGSNSTNNKKYLSNFIIL